MMQIELIDRVTGPANKIIGTIDKMTKRAHVGFGNIVAGGAELFGVGLAFNGITSEARNFNRAVGEVKSLSVADDAMQALQKTALNFSIQYGESAADFVRSSYDIQSAIAGLQGNELAKFAESSNLLAKATKSDAATITNYMGTMYGIFTDDANAIGKSNWVARLTGQTATAVEMFKTTGNGMSDAFKTLGADAKAQGIALADQMAVLGTLQATMSGSEAGTKFRAFLVGVANAEKELGVKLTDSTGKMLPIVDMLDRIKGKVGNLGAVAQGAQLKKAFGSDQAVSFINLLMKDTNGLASSIDKIGRVTGMQKAADMAALMVDPVDRLAAASNVLQIKFGGLVNRAMYPFYDSSIQALSTLSRWIDMFPHLANFIAKATIAFLGFSAAVALFAIAKGIFIIGSTGISAALAVLRFTLIPFGPLLGALRMAWLVFNMQLIAGAGVIPALRAGLVALRTQMLLNVAALRVVRVATWAYTSSLALLRAGVLAAALRFPVAAAAVASMSAGFTAATAAAWAFTAALFANPITWIVVGVVALVAGLVLLVKHWDAVKSAFGGAIQGFVSRWNALRAAIENSAVLKFLLWPLMLVYAVQDGVVKVVGYLGEIPAWFNQFKSWLGSIGVFDAVSSGLDWVAQKWAVFRALLENSTFLKYMLLPLTTAVDSVGMLIDALKKIPEWFSDFKNWLANLNPFEIIKSLDDGLVNLLNKIPGVHIEKSSYTPPTESLQAPSQSLPAVQQFSAVPGLPQQQPQVERNNYVERIAQPSPVIAPGAAANDAAAPTIVNQVNPTPVTNLVQPAPVQNLVQSSTVVNQVNPTPVNNLVQPAAVQAPVVSKPISPAPVVNQVQQPNVVANFHAPAANVPAVSPQDALASNLVPQMQTQTPSESLDANVQRQRDELKPQKVSHKQHVPAGGLRDQITNANNSKNITIERIDVKTTKEFNGHSLADELRFAS